MSRPIGDDGNLCMTHIGTTEVPKEYELFYFESAQPREKNCKLFLPTAEAKILDDLKPGDVLAWHPSRIKGKLPPKVKAKTRQLSSTKSHSQSRSTSPEALIKTVQKKARSSLRKST